MKTETKTRTKQRVIGTSLLLSVLCAAMIIITVPAKADGGECRGRKVDAICKCTNHIPCSDEHGCESHSTDDVEDDDAVDKAITIASLILSLIPWL